MRSKAIDLLIFDLDGTLVDSREAIAGAVNFALREVGLKEKSLPEISSYIGSGVDDLIRKALGKAPSKLFEKTKLVFENFRKSHPDSSRLYPGVVDMLEHFKAKRKIIITNGKYEFAEIALKKLGIFNYFSDIIGGDDIECLKPSACPLERIEKKLGINKAKTLIVGDMDIDVLAGKRAGILTCAVTYGIGKKQDIIKARPDFIIDNISQLKNIIN